MISAQKVNRFLSSVFLAVMCLAPSWAEAGRCLEILNRVLARTYYKIAPEKAPNVFVIVDGYSSGRLFPDAIRDLLRKNNRTPYIIHVHAAGEPQPLFKGTWQPENFDFDISHTGDIKATLAAIEAAVKRSNGRLVAVFPGAEGGVLLADSLAAELHDKYKIPTNGIETARRDKFLMGEKLRQSGIPAVKQMQSENVSDIMKWIETEKLLAQQGSIVVVKPIQSAGTQGVHFCKSIHDVETAVQEIIGGKDDFGNINTKVLVQEYLEGPEFVVDTVTAINPETGKPHRVITDIWRYHKRLSDNGQADIYWYDELVSPDQDVVPTLISYNARVMDALEIGTGLGHAEIKLTPQGPVLVEIGARAMGSQQPLLVENVMGHSQIDRGALAFWDPKRFSKLNTLYKKPKEAIAYAIKTHTPGAKTSPEAGNILSSLPGYVRHSFDFAPDKPLPETVDLHTTVGSVWIVGNHETIVRALQRLKEIEDQGLLEVAH